MKRFKFIFIVALWFFGTGALFSQNKYEREFRIRKSQFPEKALTYISEKLEDAKRIRFYKETDSAKTSYEAKFKKERLWYSVEFSEEGDLEDIEILIKPVDIPNAVFSKIENYLATHFTKHRIRRLQQQYPITKGEAPETTVKNAFQNLMLPSINYELIVSGKNEKVFEQFEILFNAEGDFVSQRKSLPPNYDHVLY